MSLRYVRPSKSARSVLGYISHIKGASYYYWRRKAQDTDGGTSHPGRRLQSRNSLRAAGNQQVRHIRKTYVQRLSEGSLPPTTRLLVTEGHIWSRNWNTYVKRCYSFTSLRCESDIRIELPDKSFSCDIAVLQCHGFKRAFPNWHRDSVTLGFIPYEPNIPINLLSRLVQLSSKTRHVEVFLIYSRSQQQLGVYRR